MNQIKYLDLFAGIGGFRTGLTNAGDIFLPVGWCEIDRYAQKAYRALYETEGEYFCDDATKIEPTELPDIDLICAGFPCQPFSVSGRRLGFADTRGTLFHEIVRLAEAKRPSYLLLENVPGLLNHAQGETFRTILTAIHELGYSLEWCCLNSADHGVPQQRRRVYIVGYLDSAESLMKVGSQALQNVVLFGSPDWYDWRCRNWGTKWNAYDIAAFDEDSDTITFETAWSAPHPILEKLSQMFPEVCISHYWADEDIGSNCGWAEYEGGEQIRGNDSMNDAEATEFAAQQWDYDIEKDLEMYMNRSRTKYICADNEEYDLIELFGKPAIFSNERLTNDDVPMNLFLYQLRDGENEFSPFGEIAEHITINHSGSIVTKEPIDLGEYGSIIFDESNLPSFVGDEITIGQLLRDEFSMDMPDDTEDIEIG